MAPEIEQVCLPPDAIEVGRVADAWGIKGGVKILPHSASPEALFSCRSWYVQAAQCQVPAFEGTLLVRVRQVREHASVLVAHLQGIDDRDAALALRGSSIWVPRASFPTPAQDEYYWVDIIGLEVVNRQAVVLGRVRELLSAGPQTTLVLETADSPPQERLIPFVSVFIDTVDLSARRITVDWQPDY